LHQTFTRLHHDFLIVGQGLSGSLLAWSLTQKNKSVLIISDNKPSASHIAAGLINPVTGKRLVKSEKTRQFLETGEILYSDLETFFGKKYLHPTPMLRVLMSADGRSAWEKRIKDPDYKNYIGQINENAQTENIRTPFGSFEQQQTGWLDIPALLSSLQNYFKEKNIFICEQLDNKAINFEPDYVTYKTQHARHTARHIIFCEGYHAQYNPLFSWLPFKPAKGNILTYQSHSILPDKIINAGQWILPVSDTVFRTGATYQWDELNEHPNADAKQTLENGLEQIFIHPSKYDLIKHKAGVRPCTADTQPFLGTHPENSQVSIFNGFGSRGSLTIPYYTNLFVRWKLNNQPLPENIDIKRHQKKYLSHLNLAP